MSGEVRLNSAMGGEAVTTGFTGDFSTKELDHLMMFFAREDGIIHDEIANGLVVFAK